MSDPYFHIDTTLLELSFSDIVKLTLWCDQKKQQAYLRFTYSYHEKDYPISLGLMELHTLQAEFTKFTQLVGERKALPQSTHPAYGTMYRVEE